MLAPRKAGIEEEKDGKGHTPCNYYQAMSRSAMEEEKQDLPRTTLGLGGWTRDRALEMMKLSRLIGSCLVPIERGYRTMSCMEI